MKTEKYIILAPGYATRLNPLTKNKGKPLFELAGRPILNHIIEKITELNEVLIVTNQKLNLAFKSGCLNMIQVYYNT
ncbi:sugar phosphate nucleotidyltransferase [Gracilibacillus salitolerans]|uniref:sugar phosphate nucleotidyltransferase n=1 Tax=Gracilibacillus salitolerans TaxID=2663022 RepID=UPI001890FDEE